MIPFFSPLPESPGRTGQCHKLPEQILCKKSVHALAGFHKGKDQQAESALMQTPRDAIDTHSNTSTHTTQLCTHCTVDKHLTIVHANGAETAQASMTSQQTADTS